jgi:DNA invertase Pin-like site-specific DNA recombinase
MKKMIGYIRVSTEDQGVAGNGLEAQRAALVRFAEESGYELEIVMQEVASGKLGLDARPVLNSAIKRALKEKALLVVSKLDRLSRQASFILNLMETTVQFAVAQFGLNADAFLVHMYACLGEKERLMIGVRTREALAQLKVRGVKLGGPKVKEAGKLGAAANAGKADCFAERMRPTIKLMKDAGMSHSAIARHLNDSGTKTARGGAWAPTTVTNLVSRLGAV